VPLVTAARVLLAIGLCLVLGFVMPRAGRLATPAVAALVALAYLGILVVTGELRAADLAMIRALGTKRAR